MRIIDRIVGFARKRWIPAGIAVAVAVVLSAGAWGNGVAGGASDCGNGYCDEDESCLTCGQDCVGVCTCGNEVCEPISGEDCYLCPQDCGTCCGNGVCDRDHEACHSCPEDCCCTGNDGRCFPGQRECEESCCGVCERRISCGGPSAYKCFE